MRFTLSHTMAVRDGFVAARADQLFGDGGLERLVEARVLYQDVHRAHGDHKLGNDLSLREKKERLVRRT